MARKKESDYADQIAPVQRGMSARAKAIMQKEALEARKKIIQRGLIQFRADKKLIEALLNSSELKHVPIGVFCRDIIWSYLENQPGFITKENAKTKKQLKSYSSPGSLTGKVSEDMDAEQLIDEAIEKLKLAKHRLKNNKN
ncbi:MAG: hypothetical protein SFY67_07510 [Candidatus Melainabacteria bacterium]|nr:hypothetical protein [Candidatus Melainabacteria bacterium]